MTASQNYEGPLRVVSGPSQLTEIGYLRPLDVADRIVDNHPRKPPRNQIQTENPMPTTWLSAVNVGTAAGTGLVGAIAGAAGAWLKMRLALAHATRELQQFKDDAEARRAGRVRAARKNAARLETFAHSCEALVVENERVKRSRTEREDGLTFNLPSLAGFNTTGNDSASLTFESAYRDLQREVTAAQNHVEETCRDWYAAGNEEGLDVVHRIAWRLGANALKLAARYRDHFGVSRVTPAPRTQSAERTITERAAKDA